MPFVKLQNIWKSVSSTELWFLADSFETSTYSVQFLDKADNPTQPNAYFLDQKYTGCLKKNFL